ncbi:MAG: inositol monophosphatase [Verrucomicrobia bacterium]|nr:inositol monophosphatase [Verrucomicrobiota bacterium]
MRKNRHATKATTLEHQHDIKLVLDVRCQKTIERILRRAFPGFSVLGEEGVLGDQRSEHRWVVDPIDGTVNFAYGVPHSCVSIALQTRGVTPTFLSAGSEAFLPRGRRRETSQLAGLKSGVTNKRAREVEEYETWLGVVYDPFCDELWTAIRGQPARLNGKMIRVSRRSKLRETIVSVGFAKYRHTLEQMLPVFHRLIHKVRKVRIMGAAALSMVYVASGRFDAYLESGIRIWDIAAGGLILECAGGEFWREALPSRHTYRLIANNGLLRRKLGGAVGALKRTTGSQWSPHVARK